MRYIYAALIVCMPFCIAFAYLGEYVLGDRKLDRFSYFMVGFGGFITLAYMLFAAVVLQEIFKSHKKKIAS